MAKADCTKLQLAILDMFLNIASRDDVANVDDVIAEIRKDFPVFDRATILDAVVEATTRGEHEADELADKLNRIKREARTEDALKDKIEKVMELLARGTLPEEPDHRKVASNTIEQLRKTTVNLQKWLKTSDPAMQKALQAKLDGLNAQIERGELIMSEQQEGKLHESLQAIEAQIKEAQRQITDTKTIERIEAQIEALRTHLEAGTLPSSAPRPERGTGPADLLRDVRDDLKEQLAQSEPARKAALERTIELLQARIDAKDFAPRTRVKPPSTPELDQLRYQADLLRYEVREKRNALKPRTMSQHARTVINFIIPWKAGFDFSMVLNQSVRRTLGHPVKSTEAMIETVKAWADPVYAAKINRELLNRPNMPLQVEAGYKLSALTGANEENYKGSVIERLPVLRNFARAFPTYLNIVRCQAFDEFAAGCTLTGTPTLEEAKSIVKGVYQWTGRGTLGSTDTAMQGADFIFWAPRLVMANVQSMFGVPILFGKGRARGYFAKEYLRHAGGLAAFYLLALLGGWEIEDDPRSSNVGGIRKGNVTVNPLNGMSTLIALIGRLITGQKTNAQGRVIALRNPSWVNRMISDAQESITGERPFNPRPAFGGPDIEDVEFDFAKWKVHPTWQVAHELITQKKFGHKKNEPVTVQEELVGMVGNITWGDVWNIHTQGDVDLPDALLASTLAFLGMKTQVYTGTKR